MLDIIQMHKPRTMQINSKLVRGKRSQVKYFKPSEQMQQSSGVHICVFTLEVCNPMLAQRNSIKFMCTAV